MRCYSEMVEQWKCNNPYFQPEPMSPRHKVPLITYSFNFIELRKIISSDTITNQNRLHRRSLNTTLTYNSLKKL